MWAAYPFSYTTTSSPPLRCILIYPTRPEPLHPTPVIYCLFHLGTLKAFGGAAADPLFSPCQRSSLSLCPISSRFLWPVTKQSMSFPGPRLPLVLQDQDSEQGNGGLTDSAAGSSPARRAPPPRLEWCILAENIHQHTWCLTRQQPV